MSDEEDLTYGRYLRIEELLALQAPRSRPPHPEELHFIIVHQAIELWMKLMLHDLERIVGALDAADWPGALALLGRVNHVMTHILEQMRTLHPQPPRHRQRLAVAAVPRAGAAVRPAGPGLPEGAGGLLPGAAARSPGRPPGPAVAGRGAPGGRAAPRPGRDRALGGPVHLAGRAGRLLPEIGRAH